MPVPRWMTVDGDADPIAGAGCSQGLDDPGDQVPAGVEGDALLEHYSSAVLFSTVTVWAICRPAAPDPDAGVVPVRGAVRGR
jgi:hypothetical protein